MKFFVAACFAISSLAAEQLKTNWSANINYSAKDIFQPTSEEDLIAIISENPGRVKVVGTRHTFNEIADTDGIHISMVHFNSVTVADNTVTVGAGVTYSQMAKVLSENGLALENLPSLSHINVVGSLVTGTHGGGMELPALVEYAVHYRYISPDLKVHSSIRGEDPDFFLRIMSFGTAGIISQITLNVVPEFAVRKCIYQDMPWSFIFDAEKFQALLQGSTYLSMFTDWTRPDMTSVWLGKKLDEWTPDMLKQSFITACPQRFNQANLVKKTHPVSGMPNDSVVESGIGMWHDKIQYFKSEIQPSQGGDEIQSEFFISLADFPTAFQELYEATALFKEFVKVTEIRPIKASQVPLSPAYKRDTMGINFVWVNDFDTVMRGTEIVKVVLAKYNYRVHWGKYFGYLDRSYIEQVYGPELDQLKSLLKQYEDDNPLKNCFSERLLNAPQSGKYRRCNFKNEFDAQFEKIFKKKSQQYIEQHFAKKVPELLNKDKLKAGNTGKEDL